MIYRIYGQRNYHGSTTEWEFIDNGGFFRYELLLTKKTGNETGIKSIVSSKVTLFYEVIHTQDIWVRLKGHLIVKGEQTLPINQHFTDDTVRAIIDKVLIPP